MQPSVKAQMVLSLSLIPKAVLLFGLAASVGHAQDEMAAIELLHHRDAAAAKTNDVAALAALWTDDAVALPPGEAPVIGIEAIRKWLAKSGPGLAAVEVVDYVLDFKEVRIVGDEAIEWGRTNVTLRPRGATALLKASGNILRVLKRQADGSWKISRSAWNLERPVAEK